MPGGRALAGRASASREEHPTGRLGSVAGPPTVAAGAYAGRFQSIQVLAGMPKRSGRRGSLKPVQRHAATSDLTSASVDSTIEDEAYR